MDDKKGTVLGLGSGIFWGLDSVLLGIVLVSPIFITLGIHASLVSNFMHDGISFLILFIILMIQRNVSTFWKTLFSKSGLIIVGAALLGGPIGMGCYILSIQYLGAPISASISAIYPAVGLILAHLFLNEKMKKISIIGVAVSIISIIMLGYTGGSGIPNFKLGALFIIGCVIGWGSEAVIIGYALKEDVSSEVALAIRQFVTFVTYALVIMPIIGYDKLTNLELNTKILSLILLASLLGTVSYLFYYKAISIIGASRAMGLNISYPAWAYITQAIFMRSFNIIEFSLVFMIVVGSLMSADNPKELIPNFLLKKNK